MRGKLDEQTEPGENAEAFVERQCHDCGSVSPKTESVHTLIGRAHGWRIRRVLDGASHRFEWRCRACWAALASRAPDPRR